MGVMLRRCNAAVPQQVLTYPEIRAALQQVGGESVPERVGMNPGTKTGPPGVTPDEVAQ